MISWSAVTSPKESLPHIVPKNAAQPSINKKQERSFINLVPCVFLLCASPKARCLFKNANKSIQIIPTPSATIKNLTKFSAISVLGVPGYAESTLTPASYAPRATALFVSISSFIVFYAPSSDFSQILNALCFAFAARKTHVFGYRKFRVYLKHDFERVPYIPRKFFYRSVIAYYRIVHKLDFNFQLVLIIFSSDDYFVCTSYLLERKQYALYL